MALPEIKDEIGKALTVKVQRVRVNAAAVANAYDAAYRQTHGRGCHATDWERVRASVLKLVAKEPTYLVSGPGGVYLASPTSGWMYRDPEPGTYRIL